MINIILRIAVMIINGAMMLISFYTADDGSIHSGYVPGILTETSLSGELIEEAEKFGEVFNVDYRSPDFGAIEKEMKKEGRDKLYFSKKLPGEDFFQANTWFCGPASTYCVLNYLNGGISEDQYKIGEYLETTTRGTAIEEIARVLTENNDRNMVFEVAPVGTIEEFAYNIRDSLGKGKPVIAEIATTGLDWPYYTDGHYVVIKEAEIYSEGTDEEGYPIEPWGRVVIADPLWKSEGRENEYTLSQLYDGVVNFWGQWIVK